MEAVEGKPRVPGSSELESCFIIFISCMTLLPTYLSLGFLSYKTGMLAPTHRVAVKHR